MVVASERVGASLPPRVGGETVGEVEVLVSECRGAESLTLVLRWWGEGEREVKGGVLFEATKKNPRPDRVGCLFPVRCDERGLGSYLKDARVLRFDVVDHGRVVVEGTSNLE